MINKLLAIIAFLLITPALWIIAVTPPAPGYEISIHSAYPPYFWVLILGSITCGIFILVRQAFAKERSNWWWVGFSAILFANFIILLLPLFRGYTFYGRWDPMTHIGFTKDIMLTGHFAAAQTVGENCYPATHILAASTSYVTGIDTKLVLMLIPPLFFSFYMVGIYLLSKEITQNRGQAILITAFGSLILFTWLQATFIPSILTFFLLPFILFLYYRTRVWASNKLAYAALFVLTLLAMPFFHPADGGLFLIGVFLCFELSLALYRWLNKRWAEHNAAPLLRPASSMNAILILFIAWFTWFSSFAVFSNNIKGVADWLVYHIGEAQAFRFMSWLERANVPLSDTIGIYFMQHGQHVLYFLVSGIITIWVWSKLFFSKAKPDPHYIIFSFMFIVFALTVPLSFIAGYEISYVRLLTYAIFASTIINGLGLYLLYERGQSKKLVMSIVTILLISSMALGAFNLFWSPTIKSANQQVSAMDWEGTSWFLEHQDNELLIDNICFVQFSYAHAQLGVQARPQNIRVGTEDLVPPEHFGYLENQMYGESYDEDRYFINDKLSRIRYPEGLPEYPAAWRWTPYDFDRLEDDPSVSRLYHNGEFEVLYVEGKGM